MAKKQGTKRIKTKRKVKWLNVALLLVTIIMLGIACFAGFKLVTGLLSYKAGDDVYETIYTEAGNTSLGEGETEIDFEKLKAINPEFVGWLKLDGTVINYPVAQHTDNEYYLEHLFNGDVNHMGCVYFDYRNASDLSDRNTMIYAHHTNNGSMFYRLEEYKNQSFYETHPHFVFTAEHGTYLFEPFAGKVMDGNVPFVQIVFDSDQEFLDYMQEFIDGSTFQSPIKVTAEDKIVTMSTCTDDFSNARYVLLSKVTKIKS